MNEHVNTAAVATAVSSAIWQHKMMRAPEAPVVEHYAIAPQPNSSYAAVLRRATEAIPRAL